MSSSSPKPRSKHMDAAQMLRKGWFVFRERITPAQLPQIQEEGIDPARSINRLFDIRKHRTAQRSIADVVKYVSEDVVERVASHPLSSLFSAIQDRLGTKVFVRPSCLLGSEFEALSKLFFLHASVDEYDPTPPAFFGVLYRFPQDLQVDATWRREHRLALAHEAMHVYLHLPPSVNTVAGDREQLRDLHRAYSDFVAGNRVLESLDFGPSPDVAEFEAELGALLALVAKGDNVIVPRSAADVRSLYGEYDLGFDLNEFGDLIEQYAGRLQPVTPPETVTDVAEPRQAQTSTLDPRLATFERLGMLEQRCGLLAELAREQLYAWVRRGIEDRFLRRSGETTHSKNVIIRFEPAETSESHCIIERTELASPFPSVREELEECPPHLIRFTIHYPYMWNLRHEPRHRIELLQWLGLIDRSDWYDSSKITTGVRKKTLAHYDDAAQREALLYAISIDALSGDPCEFRNYSEDGLRATLASSTLQGIRSVFDHPMLRKFIKGHLADHSESASALPIVVRFDELKGLAGFHDDASLGIAERIGGTVRSIEGDSVEIEYRDAPNREESLVQTYERDQFRDGTMPDVDDDIEAVVLVASRPSTRGVSQAEEDAAGVESDDDVFGKATVGDGVLDI